MPTRGFRTCLSDKLTRSPTKPKVPGTQVDDAWREVVVECCVRKGLLDHITIGNAGISWADVEKATAERPKVVASQIVQNEVSLED